jgi:protein gp37
MKCSHRLVRNTNRLDREDHCYALALAKRLKSMGQAKYQADGDSRTSGPGFGLTVHPRCPAAAVHVGGAPDGVRQLDIGHARVPRPAIARIWAARRLPAGTRSRC